MKIILPDLLKKALVGAALLVPFTITPTLLRAQNHSFARSYHDNKNNGRSCTECPGRQGVWRLGQAETHRRKTTFSKLKDNDQQTYWGWRHEHSDALLKIDIR